jgi:Zn-dependent protease with chaperone function
MNAKSLGRRALWLFVMTLGFYVMGAGVVLALLWVPWAEIQFDKGIGLPGILCTIGAVWVGIGLIPRFERTGPVPPIDGGARDSRLGDFVREIAQRVRHPAPKSILLLLEANAVAARRWRWRGGYTTIVGVGLPLLAFLDREELGSVIAHEFGHHLAGDVVLGPWVHRARRSVADAIGHLDGSSFFLHWPFVSYSGLLLRSSLHISRAQELHADSIAARIAGAERAAHALSVIHAMGPLWSFYWESEVVPVLTAGRLPPLLEGFRLFEKGYRAGQREGRLATEQDAKAPASAYDSHPSLAERLAALGVTHSRPEPTG